jgi:hypothetical protein
VGLSGVRAQKASRDRTVFAGATDDGCSKIAAKLADAAFGA